MAWIADTAMDNAIRQLGNSEQNQSSKLNFQSELEVARLDALAARAEIEALNQKYFGKPNQPGAFRALAPAFGERPGRGERRRWVEGHG